MLKNLLRYLGGGLAALLFFCNVPVYQGHTALFEMRVAEAAYNPAWVASIGSVSQLTGGNWSNYPYLNVISYLPGGNAGGGIFYLNSSDTTSATNFCTIVLDASGDRFYRQSGKVTAKSCGAVGNGTVSHGGADDTLPLQHGINAIKNGPIVNNYQSAPGGEFVIEAGTYRTTSTLTYGAGNNINLGIWMHGVSNGATTLVLDSATALCAINDYSATASSTISDMVIIGPGIANGCSIDVRGNGIRLHDLWLDAEFGIKITGANDVQMHDILCDQCQGAGLYITDAAGFISSQISLNNHESFGGTLQTNTFGVVCTGAHHGIVLSGIVGNQLSGIGVQLLNGCNMSMSNYSLDGVGNSIGALATHRGVWVDSGSTLTLGFGSITGWNAEGIFVGSGATVYDGGAQIYANVKSALATNLFEVAIINGSYFKSSGPIAGGSNLENGLVSIATQGAVPAGAGKLALGPGVQLLNSRGTAVIAFGGTTSPVTSVIIDGVTIDQVNQGNSAGSTPILFTGGTGVAVAQITKNIITQAFATTKAVDAAGGVLNITDNLAHFGTFPGTAGTIVGTNNRNF